MTSWRNYHFHQLNTNPRSPPPLAFMLGANLGLLLYGDVIVMNCLRQLIPNVKQTFIVVDAPRIGERKSNVNGLAGRKPLMRRVSRNLSLVFQTRSDTNQATQLHA